MDKRDFELPRKFLAGYNLKGGISDIKFVVQQLEKMDYRVSTAEL